MVLGGGLLEAWSTRLAAKATICLRVRTGISSSILCGPVACFCFSAGVILVGRSFGLGLEVLLPRELFGRFCFPLSCSL